MDNKSDCMQEPEEKQQEDPAEDGYLTCLPDKKRKHASVEPGMSGTARGQGAAFPLHS